MPCYQPYLPDFGDGDGAFQAATLYGSIFPAVWDFQLALHAHGFGTCIITMHLLHQDQVGALLGIPNAYFQGSCCRWPNCDLEPRSDRRHGVLLRKSRAGSLGRRVRFRHPRRNVI